MSPKPSLPDDVLSMKWNTSLSFDGSNYTAWKMRVKSRLEAKDLWNIVTLKEKPPRQGSQLEGGFWKREKAAKAFLLETLTDDLVVSVGTKQYAFEVYEHLEQTYEPKNWGNLVALREQFISLKYADGDEMTTHLNKLKTLADKLGRQSKRVDDKEKVCQLLTSLPESWSQFKSIYFTQDQPLAWSVMESSVMAEYARRRLDRRVPVTEVRAAVASQETNVLQRVEALLAASHQQGRTLRRGSGVRSTPYPSQQQCFLLQQNRPP